MIRSHWIYIATAVACLLFPSIVYSQPATAKVGMEQVVIHLNASAECSSNLLQLKDVATIRGTAKWGADLGSLTIAPSPQVGKPALWSRKDIELALERRGINLNSLKWEGGQQCRVVRSPNKATTNVMAAPLSTFPPDNNSYPWSTGSTTGVSEGAKSGAKLAQKSDEVSHDRFTSAFLTPAMIAQAERIASTAIEKYLQTKTNSTIDYTIRPEISTELAPRLLQMRQIVGVDGGLPPWDGEQSFEFLIKGPTGEMVVPVKAIVELPELVVAAEKQLAKGRVLREEDLILIPMPRGSKESPEKCFTDVQELIGKELKRSMSTQQVVLRQDAGSPTLIHSGDAIKLEVIAGSLVVETNGKAIESGGLDDLIHVESLDNRKRLLARVTGERVVEVVSQGTSNQSYNKNNGRSFSKVSR
jgi:flagella basal body P-ring formation protein FlgA